MKYDLSGFKHGPNTLDGEYEILGRPRQGSQGWFVTIPGDAVGGGGSKARVYITPDVAQKINSEISPNTTNTQVADQNQQPDPEKTKEIIKQISEEFMAVESLANFQDNSRVRGLMVQGPPGIGKTHTIMQSGRLDNAERISGYCTPINVYKALFRAQKNNVPCIFDDCDSVLLDQSATNVLKSALETDRKSSVSYLSESKALADEGYPTRFEFTQQVIFLTNVVWSANRVRNATHVHAIVSRCHVVELSIETLWEKILWITHQTQKNNLLVKQGCTVDQQNAVLGWIIHNRNELRDLSMRMVVKMGDLVVRDPDNWQRVAEITQLKRR